jgi:hypothetical protein
MKKINQKLLDSFTKPVCKKCNEELFVSNPATIRKLAAMVSSNWRRYLVPIMCINEKCSNKYRSVELDHN